MRYSLEDNSNFLLIQNDKEIIKIIIDENKISKYEVLKLFAENSVEPCHAQNIYDDLISD